MPAVPFGSRAVSHREASRRQERRRARDVGADVQRGSGSVPHRRGDLVARRGDMLGEVKYTARGRRSFTVALDVMAKIEREARAVGKLPFLLTEVKERGTHNDGAWFIVLPGWVAVALGLVGSED